MRSATATRNGRQISSLVRRELIHLDVLSCRIKSIDVEFKTLVWCWWPQIAASSNGSCSPGASDRTSRRWFKPRAAPPARTGTYTHEPLCCHQTVRGPTGCGDLAWIGSCQGGRSRSLAYRSHRARTALWSPLSATESSGSARFSMRVGPLRRLSPVATGPNPSRSASRSSVRGSGDVYGMTNTCPG